MLRAVPWWVSCSFPHRLRCLLMPTSCTAVRCWRFCSRIMMVSPACHVSVSEGRIQASLRSQQPFSASSSPLLALLSPMCSVVSTLSFSAAFVLCQAVLILFADVSVLDGCKIWQLASFFSLFSPFPPPPSRQQRIAWGAGWDRCAASAVICE